MKLLVTGAAHFNDGQLNRLSSLGFDVLFQQDEKDKPSFDYSSVDAVICNGLFLFHDIDEFANLKFIQLTSAGLDRVPLEKISLRQISLYNARGVYSVPMAEFAVAGVLDLYKKMSFFFDKKRSRLWEKNRSLRELYNSTVAIIGFGNVGNECAKRFKAFGTKIIGVDVINNGNECDEFYSLSDIEKAVSQADIVILTLPLTDETRGMFNKDLLSRFKNGAVLVNISRGAVVNENDLIYMLKSGHIGGAVLDVFENEPLGSESPLWDFENVIITPHNSFVSPENSDRLFNLAYKNLSEFKGGQ